MRALFCEELGAVVQIRRSDRSQVMGVLRAAGLGACTQFIGAPNPWDQIRIIRNARAVLSEKRVDLQRAWSETSFRMQRCATTRNVRSRNTTAFSMPATPACRSA
jgi:phosphoribosylformylglycinamidine synthase